MKTRLLVLLLLMLLPLSAAADEVIPPAYPVPEYVGWLLEIAGEEVGYTEGDHGRTKYGEWIGDPYAQWCAEYLCWSVDQVDRQHGTQLLDKVFPMYSGQNSGRNWFIQQGRYVVRWGNLEDWGYQWLKGEDHFLSTGDYIPQPGDWVFFTWTDDRDTDHVAMVEYCTRAADGSINVHVLEGNAPDKVQRTAYPLTYTRILGYGTVHDVADYTMRSGNRGAKVLALQEKLCYLGYLDESRVDGHYGSGTVAAVRTFQNNHGLKVTGIANINMQRVLDRKYTEAVDSDPATWLVVDED
ncbi:MAG: peptidoglycan-binding protein [Clostridia bacterium]|nr:peptidoglycan-binding protein [Clostridia bacterium]